MTKRTAADFAMFKSPEFISGYKSMATLQPLNQTDTHGLFLQNKDIDVCKWTAKQSDFEKGSVLLDYEHTFVFGISVSLSLVCVPLLFGGWIVE